MKLIVGFLLIVAGCKKQPPSDAPSAQGASAPADPLHTPGAHQAAVQQLSQHFARVHFDFDSSALTEVSRAALDTNAKILQQHPRITIQVQGHADERGTTDYNLALGQRRARAVAEHLAQAGVAPSRIQLISLGEERPLAAEHNEIAWSQNRRCEFRILVGGPGIEGTTSAL